MKAQIRELLAKYDAGEMSADAFIVAVREVVNAAIAGELTAEQRAEVERLNNQLLAKRQAYRGGGEEISHA